MLYDVIKQRQKKLFLLVQKTLFLEKSTVLAVDFLFPAPNGSAQSGCPGGEVLQSIP
jgi:hypothetical protein